MEPSVINTELFDSDRYKAYLTTMAKFHNYSFNNTLLIAMQGGQLVAGFNKWKDTFHRTVKKGEKGIKILAPAPYKVKQKMEKLDEQGKPILDKDGKPLTEEKTVQIPAFMLSGFLILMLLMVTAFTFFVNMNSPVTVKGKDTGT